MGRMTKVFISYSSKDRDFVLRLAIDLEKRLPDVQIWYDMLMPMGDSWADTLIREIETADVILAVLSPDYLISEWAQQELKVALLRRAEGGAVLIPILIRSCFPPALLASIHWVDFTENYEDALTRLIWGITGRKPPAIKGEEPGALLDNVQPTELGALRQELQEAVRLFKSRTGESESTYDRVSASPQGKRKCFIVMPFGDPDLQIVYEDFVKPIIEDECYLQCERGDDVFGSNVIMEDILRSIQLADIVVADLTRKNANVFYEVGICHALGRV
jgi:hypothetical protein